MGYECLRDCIDHNAIRYDRGKIYDIDPENSCAMHFSLPPDKRAMALLSEKERRLKTAENLKTTGKQKKSAAMADPYEFDAELEKLTVQ